LFPEIGTIQDIGTGRQRGGQSYPASVDQCGGGAIGVGHVEFLREGVEDKEHPLHCCGGEQLRHSGDDGADPWVGAVASPQDQIGQETPQGEERKGGQKDPKGKEREEEQRQVK